MRRRDFIGLAGGSIAVCSPIAAKSQQPGMPVIGYLNGGSPFAATLDAFHQGLGENG
jgi:putative tryptophan/tyrosine transport system substrate-binding protein